MKGNDILFTTYDYQNWDGEISENNDEYYFYYQFKDSIIGGNVKKIAINRKYDLKIILDNNIIIESFTSNGYFHYDEEDEQWRLLTGLKEEDMNKKTIHMVVFNKKITFTDENE